MSECPLCKFKGQLIQDQFREIRYCQTNECPIIQYEVPSITTPQLAGWTR